MQVKKLVLIVHPVTSPHPFPTFNVVLVPEPCTKHWAMTLNGGRGEGYLGELAAVLWVEAILTMARLGFGQESLNNLKLIVAIIAL